MRTIKTRCAGTLAATLAFAACAPATTPAPAPVGAVRVPQTILLRGADLAAARTRVRDSDASLKPAYDALIHDANAALTVGPFSVTQKHRTPPSNDVHDYMSLAPYWWPDPSKPNGLPFIRRDGDVNPESRLDTDSPRFGQMADAVETLTLAYFFSGDARYAQRAGVLLRTWFLDPATRMNPNLRFGQAIPGVTDGRGIGIIDTRNLTTIVDDVILLDHAPGWSAADSAGMRDWSRAFLGWLQTSVQGKEEEKAQNNHGTWYDSQAASLALFVGDTALARRLIGTSAKQRLAAQIAADGKQPEELARTRPLHYSLFNLQPFARLAEMGRHVGVDLWGYTAPNGANLRSAVLYVAPYFDPSVKFPLTEITPGNPEEFLQTIRSAERAYDDPRLRQAVLRMRADALARDRSRLLFPDAEGTRRARVGSVRPDASSLSGTAAALDSLSAHALRFAAVQLAQTADRLDPAAGYPRLTGRNGEWEVAAATSWTSGFFAGELWQMYALAGDSIWRARAERWTAGLEVNKTRTNTHDLGFLIFNSFGLGYSLTKNSHYRDVVLDASRSLATRFNPAVGAIKSWDTEGLRDRRSSWAFPVIIDNMMNLKMLFWAGANGGDPRWREIAERHALTSAKAHVRDDGSTAHVAVFDPKTGALLARTTWQGYSDSSAWARGQAWAIYGFTQAYEETRRPELLAAARKAADWYLSHLPPDGVPYWDFRDPSIPNAPRDASAAAIASSGLIELFKIINAPEAERYRASAAQSLQTLASRYLATEPGHAAVLEHSVGGKPQGVEIDVGMIYADYYFIEALAKWRKAAGLPSFPK